MPRPALLAALTLGAALSSAAAVPAPIYCPVDVLRDYDLGWAYYAQIRLDPTCPYGGVARVRKSSNISTRANGAPYQPISPVKGAWNVTWSGNDVPNAALFTLINRHWEYWTGASWRTVVAR